MKKLIAVMVIISLIVAGLAHASNKIRESDDYIRDRVLLLKSKEGTCSAVEVKTATGAIYTLSAAHCSVLLENDSVEAVNEQDIHKRLKLVDIDYVNDLMLLAAFDSKSISIANVVYKHERIHVIAHGAGYPSYRVDGELLIEQKIKIEEPLHTEAQEAYCSKVPGSTVVPSFFGDVCLFDLNEMQSSANIQPGSSGGPVLNAKGELVGIVSSGDGVFSGFVPLIRIHEFLKAR